ncbi:hypothetical protein F1643_07530 [Azospirillum sp. INR13]|nr:hypothetical protein [Azospirillum sp. INR13]
MKPGEGAAQPWLDSGRLRARVRVEALGGATDGLLVESGDVYEPVILPPATRLRWFAAADRAELCVRIRRGEDGGQGPVRLAFACPAGKEAETLSRAVSVAEGREVAAGGIHFGERPLGGGLALVFTGAAAAYEGMGRELFLSMPDVGRGVTARFPILAHAAERLYGSTEPLDAMAQLQTCALICQTHAEVSRGVLGLRPDAVMGLSSGETNALFAGGGVVGHGRHVRGDRRVGHLWPPSDRRLPCGRAILGAGGCRRLAQLAPAGPDRGGGGGTGRSATGCRSPSSMLRRIA